MLPPAPAKHTPLPASAQPSTRRPWLILGAILLLPAALYLNSLRDYFFVDDFVWLYFSQGSFTEFFRNLTVSQHIRPLLYVYFKLAYALFHLDPLGYNLVGLVLHLLNTALVFFCARVLARDLKTAAFSALLFSVYFYGCEAVVWISSVSVLGVTLLFLLALSRLVRPPGRAEMLVMLGLLSLALLAHEAAGVLPLIWMLYLLVYPRSEGGWKAQTPALAAAWLLSLAYFMFHLRLYPVYRHVEAWPLAVTAWKSLVVMFLPAPILLAQGNTWLGRLHLPFQFGWGNLSVAFALGLAAAAYGLIKSGWHRDPFLRFGAGWLALTLVPFIFKTAHMNAHFIDHRYSYLPAVGLSFLVGGLLARWHAGGRKAAAVAVLSALVLVNAIFLLAFKADKAIGKRVKAEAVSRLQTEIAQVPAEGTATFYAPEYRVQEIKAMVGLFSPAAADRVRVLPGEWSPADDASRPRGPVFQFDSGINRISRVETSRP